MDRSYGNGFFLEWYPNVIYSISNLKVRYDEMNLILK